MIGSAQTRDYLQRLRNQLLPLRSQQLWAAQKRPMSTLEFSHFKDPKNEKQFGLDLQDVVSAVELEAWL